jgi:hypothetical protein
MTVALRQQIFFGYTRWRHQNQQIAENQVKERLAREIWLSVSSQKIEKRGIIMKF